MVIRPAYAAPSPLFFAAAFISNNITRALEELIGLRYRSFVMCPHGYGRVCLACVGSTAVSVESSSRRGCTIVSLCPEVHVTW